MKPEFFKPPIDNLELCNLWDYIQQRYSVKDIEPSYYIGLIASAPIATYNAKIMYISLNLRSNTVLGGVVGASFTIYDEANNSIANFGINNSFYNGLTTTVQSVATSENVGIFNFWRLAGFGNNYMIFNGYKLTLT